MARITVRDISVDFPLHHSDSRSLRRAIMRRATGRFGADTKQRPFVRALRQVTFDVRTGDRLGLVGSNGAGKSTLLRVLSGIYQPTSGAIDVCGRVASLLDPGETMNGELTGRENIRLYACFYAMPPAAVAGFEQDVEAFADIAEFLDLPVRNYSSGMVIRLSFAIVTAIRREILLLDEWILAGDARFMDKARERRADMVRHADILVLASHSSPLILEWCNRLIWMEQGRIRADGPPREVLAQYLTPQQFERALAQAPAAS